jgi:hypothetical protein
MRQALGNLSPPASLGTSFTGSPGSRPPPPRTGSPRTAAEPVSPQAMSAASLPSTEVRTVRPTASPGGPHAAGGSPDPVRWRRCFGTLVLRRRQQPWAALRPSSSEAPASARSSLPRRARGQARQEGSRDRRGRKTIQTEAIRPDQSAPAVRGSRSRRASWGTTTRSGSTARLATPPSRSSRGWVRDGTRSAPRSPAQGRP